MTVWRMRIAWYQPKATNTYTQVVQYSLLFQYNSGGTNAPQCYVLRTLPVLCRLREFRKGLRTVYPHHNWLFKRLKPGGNSYVPLAVTARNCYLHTSRLIRMIQCTVCDADSIIKQIATNETEEFVCTYGT